MNLEPEAIPQLAKNSDQKYIISYAIIKIELLLECFGACGPVRACLCDGLRGPTAD